MTGKDRVIQASDKRRYYRFRATKFYGGIATADCMGVSDEKIHEVFKNALSTTTENGLQGVAALRALRDGPESPDSGRI